MAKRNESMKKSSRRGGLKTAGGVISGASSIIKGVGAILEAVGGNHPSWYEAYPLTNLVSLNFGQREKIGSTIPWNNVNVRSPSDSRFCVDLVIPAATGKDAFRESHQIIMNKLRAATGSNVTYDIDDLMCYTLNAREIIALYALIRRTILCTRIVDIYDEDAPYKYACLSNSGNAATSLSITQITANLATDTVRLNRLAAVIGSLIPIKMTLMARTAWMFSNVFADSKTAKFSTKMFTINKTGFWSKQSNGEITRTQVIIGNTTLTNQLDQLEALVNAFSSNLQNSRIAGDYMKAFGAFFTHLQEVTEATRILPLYDEAALTQLQNATIMYGNITSKYSTSGIPENVSSITTHQDLTDTSQFADSFGGADLILAPCTARARDALVNTYKDHVTPGELLSLTRLVTLTGFTSADVGIVTTGGVSTVNQRITACGTEILNTVAWVLGSGGGAINFFEMPYELKNIVGTMMTPYAASGDASVYDSELSHEFWGMDDWSPRMVITVRRTAPSVTPNDVWSLWDYSNWATVSKDNLSTYHQLAVMSLLATPDHVKEQSDFQFI